MGGEQVGNLASFSKNTEIMVCYFKLRLSQNGKSGWHMLLVPLSAGFILRGKEGHDISPSYVSPW